MIDLQDFASLTDVQWRSRFEVERGIYIAEGEKTIRRALLAGHLLRRAITAARWIPGLLAAGVPAELIGEADETEMERITGFHVHRGALAAFQRPEAPVLDTLLVGARRLVIVEDVVDHANIGAIMRSAAAFEIDAVLLTPACADPLYRRSIKVSMGAVFSIPWTRMAWPGDLATLHAAGIRTLALTPAADALDIRQLASGLRSQPLALMLGTEGSGLSPLALSACSHRVRIPMAHGVDSLNVAAAAAVACYELTR